MESWNPLALPQQPGRTFVVTGGTAGIGYFIAEQLASTAATVVIAARSAERADAARRAINSAVPEADTRFIPLDLASLASIRRAAEAIDALGRVDAIVHNAGHMGQPRRRERTADGLEVIVGTGHVGTFALAALTTPTLARTAASRVVTTSSGLVRVSKMVPNDLNSERRYLGPGRTYVKSKAAIEIATFELARQLRLANSRTTAIVSYPGMASNSLTPERSGVVEHRRGERWHEPGFGFLGGGKDVAAWPAVRAVLQADIPIDKYVGPKNGFTGPTTWHTPLASSLDFATAESVWRETERLSGVQFSVR